MQKKTCPRAVPYVECIIRKVFPLFEVGLHEGVLRSRPLGPRGCLLQGAAHYASEDDDCCCALAAFYVLLWPSQHRRQLLMNVSAYNRISIVDTPHPGSRERARESNPGQRQSLLGVPHAAYRTRPEHTPTKRPTARKHGTSYPRPCISSCLSLCLFSRGRHLDVHL